VVSISADVRKPHICFVSESRATYGLLMGESCDVVGGAELQQSLIASALQGLGYPVTFVVSDCGQPDKVATDQGITLIKARSCLEGVRGLNYISQILRLFRAMNKADADIYYQRIGGAGTGIVALFCKLKRKPFVFSVAHNTDLDPSKPYSKWRYNKLYHYGLTHAAVVVVQTEDQMRLLKEKWGREGILIRSIFADVDEADRRRRRLHVLWVGNFKRMKRPEMFLNLAASLPRYKFVMVGGRAASEKRLFDEIGANAENIPNLHLTGAVPYKEVGRYFSEAKVFVNTSSGEGFPNTYLQAWCRGVPVVGTFDADSLITRYGLGRHCSTVEELVQAVDELMKDEALRASIGERAIRYVGEHHSPQAVAAQYDKLFMQLCHQGRGRSLSDE